MIIKHGSSNHIAAAIAAAILMGTLGYFVRESHQTNVLAFFRFFIGLVIMGVIMAIRVWRKEEKFTVSHTSFYSGICIGLCILFYFYAIERMNIGVAAFLIYIGPVFAIIGETVIVRHLPPISERTAIGIALAGVICISSLDFNALSSGNGTEGLIFAMLSALTYGGYILLNRRIPHGVTLYKRTFWQSLAATAAITISFLFDTPTLDGLAEATPYFLIVGIVHRFVVLMLVAYAIKGLSATQYGSLSYIEPLTATILGYVIYNDNLTLEQSFGIVLIVLSTTIQCFLIKQKEK